MGQTSARWLGGMESAQLAHPCLELRLTSRWHLNISSRGVTFPLSRALSTSDLRVPHPSGPAHECSVLHPTATQ